MGAVGGSGCGGLGGGGNTAFAVALSWFCGVAGKRPLLTADALLISTLHTMRAGDSAFAFLFAGSPVAAGGTPFTADGTNVGTAGLAFLFELGAAITSIFIISAAAGVPLLGTAFGDGEEGLGASKAVVAAVVGVGSSLMGETDLSLRLYLKNCLLNG